MVFNMMLTLASLPCIWFSNLQFFLVIRRHRQTVAQMRIVYVVEIPEAAVKKKDTTIMFIKTVIKNHLIDSNLDIYRVP